MVNGGTTKILLQVLSRTIVGPIFFEFIQRKGNEGFGEGNFQALFESIERADVAWKQAPLPVIVRSVCLTGFHMEAQILLFKLY